MVGPVQGGGRITKGTKVREHERGGLQRGWHRGGDLAVAGTAATLRVPETRAEQLFVVRRRGAGRRPAVAGTAESRSGARYPRRTGSCSLSGDGERGEGGETITDNRVSAGRRSAINKEIFCDFFPKRGNGLDRGCSLSEFRI